MEIDRIISVNVKDGDLELRVGKALTTFAYKGVDKFTFRTAELETLSTMIRASLDKMKDAQDKLKEPCTPTETNTSKAPQ